MPVRETPAPDPLQRSMGPSHTADPGERTLAVDDIQGNILGGFSKDYQTLIFLRIDNADPFKQWLPRIAPCIASLNEVVAFNRLFKSMRVRRGELPTVEPLFKDPPLKVTWVNIAFTFEGLSKLQREDTKQFKDQAFRVGMRARSTELGDPLNEKSPGHPSNWRMYDGPEEGADRDKLAHVLIIVAGDGPREVADMVSKIERDAQNHGAALVGFGGTGHDQGQDLPGDLSGHEHFGFLDGVSQPGVRGLLSSDPYDVLTPRQNPNKRDQGKPGQDLLWPGEFVLGAQKEPRNDDVDPQSGEPVSGPVWAQNGSFLVFRRLSQQVSVFHSFLQEQAKDLQNVHKAPAKVTPDLVGAQLVGRWRSGAPVMRTPNDMDLPSLGEADCANNNFEFQSPTAPLPAVRVDDWDCTDANSKPPPADFLAAGEDKAGLVCPFTAHIRKVYPRDDVTLSGRPFTGKNGDELPLDEDDTQKHRLLRRGLPFGRPLTHSDGCFSTPEHPAQADEVEQHLDRGLHFVAYQASIDDQFEFVTRNWVNNPDFKEPSKERQSDSNEGQKDNLLGGFDPIIGQKSDPDKPGDRTRAFTVAFGDGQGNRVPVRITTDLEWVIPTGGGYFFSPSISALGGALAK